ncbi:hypothetical protein [Thioclava sp. IC9]|uniref:hypothetical protein n=1 Tax=Thioclava sp. IC9 TaxID=1973007 RepID=UPI000B53C2B1|nr:hypothetical protein [Thioclava sp. IC9]OWY06301.1 hypothetical protein B6V76_00380 [Thioclava sp. IC9]
MSEIESFFRVKEDKRRELLRSWGLNDGPTVAWSELWSAIGLDPYQDKDLWADLKLPLLLPSDVAPMVRVSVETLNGWCRTNTLPAGFPPPICVGPRKKLWINLEILARRQPEIYADAAGKIRRSRLEWHLPGRPSITLDPDLSIAALQKNTSVQADLANVQSIETGTDGFMLADIEELIANSNAADDKSSFAETPMMDRVLDMLDREMADGAASSPRALAKTALRSLLGTRGKRPENTELSLDIFDAWFPLNGWNRVTMPRLSREVYNSYRKRARAAIARALGVTEEKEKLRRQEDRWTELAEWLSGLPRFKDKPASLVAITSTLTLLCREAQLSTEELSQAVILRLFQMATTKQKRSLRNAFRTIYDLQNDSAHSLAIREFFPTAIEPVRTGPRKSYTISKRLLDEIDELTLVSYRKGYIEIAQSSKTRAKKTRDQHKYALRTVVDALIATGHLMPDAETATFALSNRNAMVAACQHIYTRVKQGELAASTATTKMSYLPAILERNGIVIPDLRAKLLEVPEFCLHIDKSEMPDETQRICRHLIDDLAFRADFLLSHAAPRAAAENIIRAARRAKRDLTHIERTRVRQLGTVALFCALECGCAPIRVGNFLAISIEGSAPWLIKNKSKEYMLHIPATHTKNKKPIKAPLCASEERYLETVEWFLQDIRWLFFWDQAANVVSSSECLVRLAKQLASKSDWLVPGVKDPSRCLTDTTFRKWFENIMVNIAGITIDPSNFRHGQASLLYFLFPDQIETIAARLGDTVDTVLRYYAWIHQEKLMRKGQSMLVSTIRPGF